MAEQSNPYFKKEKSARGTLKLEFTKLGLKKVEEMADLGCSITEIASVIGISARTLHAKNNADGGNRRYDRAFARAYNSGRSRYLIHIRKSQKDLAEVNASMAIHLGKHELGQHDKPQEHLHTHRVVGTMPDYDATSEQWRKQFAPSGAPRLENHVEDAEVIEIEVMDDLIEKEDIPYGD